MNPRTLKFKNRLESNMHYITDTQGHKHSVMIPIKEWVTIQNELDELYSRVAHLEDAVSLKAVQAERVEQLQQVK